MEQAMSDIVERLRRSKAGYYYGGEFEEARDNVCVEAADEIERLRDELLSVNEQEEE
jgi:hypothetical protein